MRYVAPQTERNKKNCVICGDIFYDRPSGSTVCCKKQECRFTRRSQKRSKHGMSGTRIYSIWSTMKHRCKRKDSYKNVKVCEEWGNLETFCKWAIASGYTDELEIDRKNSELGYEPGNCRWVTRQQQAQNRRKKKASASRYNGVTRFKRSLSKPWKAAIYINGKGKYLGCFATEEDAARAYDAAAIKFRGEFACLNFKDTPHETA